MNYNELVKWLQTMLEVPLNDEDANFTRVLPLIIKYAEGRIYRELTFLATKNTGWLSSTMLKGIRQFSLPDKILVLNQISVWTPSGALVTPASKRVTLERITPEALNMFWPQSSFKQGIPQKYAILGRVAPPYSPGVPGVLEHIVIVMPTPDKDYTLEYVGVIQPDPISPTNPETYLSVKYPELLMCACMVVGCGYQRDYGAQADDPQKAMSWDAQYNYLKQGILIQEARMRGAGPDWTPAVPEPVAQSPT